MCVMIVVYLNGNYEKTSIAQMKMYHDNDAEINNTTVIVERDDPTVIGGIKRSPQELNDMDRVNNPLRWPYKSPDHYQTAVMDQPSYSGMPFQVVTGGGRRGPTYGGSQTVMPRSLYPIRVNDHNIAPVNISTRGPIGAPQQVGAIYKVDGNDNDVLPLYGRRKYPNDNKYEYYTQIGKMNVKVPLVTERKNDELMTNDLVFIKGNPNGYRTSMYETDFPQYIPY